MESGYSSFGIIGGDKRQLYCARSLCDDGYVVTLGGFDKVLSMKGVELTSPFEAALMSEIVILPLPSVNADGRIPAPFSEGGISLTPNLITAMKGKKIFCGFKDKLIKAAPSLHGEIFDYYAREEFAVENAVVTAEGAVEIAMNNYEGTLNGSNCLVAGFGRIGKALLTMLKGLGANVTVSARKPSDFAWIKSTGANFTKTENIQEPNSFDIIFNTVPARIFTPVLLAKLKPEVLIIDLASADGGVDFFSAERMGITAIHALSLPGKCAPKTAGEIVKNTIYHILEEEYR
ncbi:MAG: dipicolinate synthase subunit DpsA [Eubacteriales bacterium]|nr:dipicolinate synthase subunit DpsA [Eubacteriales bacterium]